MDFEAGFRPKAGEKGQIWPERKERQIFPVARQEISERAAKKRLPPGINRNPE
jgi:hypothetical protein